MTLYQINQQIEEAFYSGMDPETGEIIGDLSSLDALQIAREEKIENICLFYKNLMSDAEAIRAEEKKLAERRRACENHAERLKKYLADNLQGEAFKTPRAAVSYRRSTSVNVTDLWAIPEEYLKMEDPKPIKTEIAKALKAGKEVTGAELVESQSMSIR